MVSAVICVPALDDGVRPALEARVIDPRYSQHVGDHEERERRREALDEVDRARELEAREQLVDEHGDALLERTEAPGLNAAARAFRYCVCSGGSM
jgi:hypothetical protein